MSRQHPAASLVDRSLVDPSLVDPSPVDQSRERAYSTHGDIAGCFYDLSLELWTTDDWDAAFSRTLDFLRKRLELDQCALYLQLPGYREPRLVCSGSFPDGLRGKLEHRLKEKRFEPDGTCANFRILPLPLRAGRAGYLVLPAAGDRGHDSSWVDEFSRQLARVLMTFNTVYRVRRQDLYEERAAISRELHDSLAQSLTYLKIQVSRLEASLQASDGGGGTESIVSELRTRLNRAYRELRELMTTFRLTMHGKSFNMAVEDLIKEYEQYSSIAFTLDNRLEEDCLTVDEEMQVLQIIREALSNIVQHSKARNTDIQLDMDDRARLCLTISDDGIGCDKARMRAQHHGMLIMQERAFGLNGRFNVTRSEEGGTCIRVCFKPSTDKSLVPESVIADTFV